MNEAWNKMKLDVLPSFSHLLIFNLDYSSWFNTLYSFSLSGSRVWQIFFQVTTGSPKQKMAIFLNELSFELHILRSIFEILPYNSKNSSELRLSKTILVLGRLRLWSALRKRGTQSQLLSYKCLWLSRSCKFEISDRSLPYRRFFQVIRR